MECMDDGGQLSAMSGPVLEARQITKRFPGVVALKDVSFDLQVGEIHALCGENGAGKSTLIKLLSGIHPHGTYEGELLVGGETASFRSIADAERAGIAVIYQELALVPQMTVAENIFLGHEPRRWGLLNRGQMVSAARGLLERFGVRIDPEVRCQDLGVGERQLVEIVKALSKESRILILDEPSAALAEHEVVVLLEILRDLRKQGIASIYISHKLDEVFAIADRITVLRDGSTICTTGSQETRKGEVIQRMVGRDIEDLFPRRRQGGGDTAAPVLRVAGLSVADGKTGRVRLRDLTFSVAAGEVLGIGGLMGAGRSELLMHLFGAWGTRQAGEVQLAGKALKAGDPRAALRGGLALVSEDRRRYGLVLEQSIGFNLSLSSLRRVAAGGVVQASREYRRNEEISSALRVKAKGLEAPVGKLSGGNQQKVVLGKALLAEPKVLFLDEPTRGIDVGAKIEIYEIINRLMEEGKAIVLVSSELPELMGMSDRILMLHEGMLAGEYRPERTSAEELLAAAMGQGD